MRGEVVWRKRVPMAILYGNLLYICKLLKGKRRVGTFEPYAQVTVVSGGWNSSYDDKENGEQ